MARDRYEEIKDPDRFLGIALTKFHSAEWHRAALMFKTLHDHIKRGGTLPHDWRWRTEGEWHARYRADTIVARKVGVLIGMTGGSHDATCVEAMGPKLDCTGHDAPECVETDCKVKSAFMSDDKPRCDHHYRLHSSRVSKMMGYGGPSGSWTGD